MGVDLIVLLLTVMALARKKMHSHLWKLLFQDGLVYFCVTFLCNSAPAASLLALAPGSLTLTLNLQILNVVNLNGESLDLPYETIQLMFACAAAMMDV